jgi:hypothetical protein
MMDGGVRGSVTEDFFKRVHTKYDSFVFLSSSEEFFSLEECSN